ncbi:MAG: amidohydrolase family protein [Deltaproteobacteria bacterium]|nr:amidohydrolase family protein [Deltaproteobacteria bacterium]
MAIEKQPTAFIHANLIPMTTATVLFDHTVVVEGKQITVVGPSNDTEIPDNANVINCRNAFLMPGLSDMHMHLRYSWISDAWPVSPLKLYIANGVTTIRCFGPGGKTGKYGLNWRKDIDAGRLVGPSILTCGPMLGGHFKKDPEQIVIKQKYQRFDFIKIYSYVTKEEYHTILATAKKLNIYTAGHIPFQVGLDGVLAEGMDEIAHIEEFLWEFSDLDRQRYFENKEEWMAYAVQTTFDRFAPFLELNPQEKEQKLEVLVATILDKLKDRQIPVCTTLVVDDLIEQKLFYPEQFLRKPENRFLPPGYLDRFRKGKEKHQMQFKGGEVFAPFKYMLDKKLLVGLKKINIPLLLSTDAGTGRMGIVPGFSIHDELRILVENGFTPYEAIAAGTVVASGIVKRMNGQDDFGTIVPGKRADLILLQKNPLEDVANVRKISGVMAAGQWYDHTSPLSTFFTNLHFYVIMGKDHLGHFPILQYCKKVGIYSGNTIDPIVA